ncbi:MAG: group II intron reverse transcriptase domain-containing protein [Deltaproteobacteria bacterium]|nr:group II intron reverse transcriptase domain-containing protein [Deltaproteobacteria bacterium]
MSKRVRIELDEIAELDNLYRAFWRAAKGKRDRQAVQDFALRLDHNLSFMRRDIINGDYSFGGYSRFMIYDPKPRVIHAACFRERVLHHAIMAHLEPVFERHMVGDTFACRPGRGVLAAVNRAQQHIRRYPWYAKVDVRKFFDSVDHDILFRLLSRRFKGEGLLILLKRIIESYQTDPGKGLPIGSLTSQHFANFYLSRLDRLLLQNINVLGTVRYMDDIIWFCNSREQAKETMREVSRFLAQERKLDLKQNFQINRSLHGVSFCGFRVLAGTLRPSPRRRRRYAARRKAWERAFEKGLIDEKGLQTGYASALAIVAHCDCRSWLKRQLGLNPMPPCCHEIVS